MGVGVAGKRGMEGEGRLGLRDRLLRLAKSRKLLLACIRWDDLGNSLA